MVLERGGIILGEEKLDGVNTYPYTQTVVSTLLYQPNGIANGSAGYGDRYTVSDIISKPVFLDLEQDGGGGGGGICCDEFPEYTDVG